MSRLTTLIGFDFGMRYIGVAIGQTITMTAEPYTTLSASQGRPNWGKVKELLIIWKPDALVVGVPVHLDGTVHAITLAARHFLTELTNRFDLPVYAAEERLTSVEARARLFDQGGFKALSKKAVDSLSAQLILEGWLNEYSLSSNF